jgi:hypothetical protein
MRRKVAVTLSETWSTMAAWGFGELALGQGMHTGKLPTAVCGAVGMRDGHSDGM